MRHLLLQLLVAWSAIRGLLARQRALEVRWARMFEFVDFSDEAEWIEYSQGRFDDWGE